MDVVGVAGSTLTDEWGERAAGSGLLFMAEDTTELDVEDVEEAFECVCTWWILRTDETDEDVDLRPRSPAEDRR